MSHALYTTSAIVLSSRSLAEANRSVTLFTEEFGLVRAIAQGVRLSKSKLRYRLYTFARVHVTLVRGREVWRLVGVEEQERPEILLGSTERTALFARVASLVSRFVHGEEADRDLYGELEALYFLLNAPGALRASLVEAVFVGRLLSHLGYLPDVPGVTERLFEPELLAGESVDPLFEKKLVETINMTLSRSQL